MQSHLEKRGNFSLYNHVQVLFKKLFYVIKCTRLISYKTFPSFLFKEVEFKKCFTIDFKIFHSSLLYSVRWQSTMPYKHTRCNQKRTIILNFDELRILVHMLHRLLRKKIISFNIKKNKTKATLTHIYSYIELFISKSTITLAWVWERWITQTWRKRTHLQMYPTWFK